MDVQVSGNPSPEELAAALAVLMSSGPGAEPAAQPEPSRWADRETHVRRPLRPGPGAWRHAV